MLRAPRRLAVLAFVSLFAACSADQAPTAATSPATLSPSAGLSSGSTSLELAATRAREQLRVTLAASSSQGLLDSLQSRLRAGDISFLNGISPLLVCVPAPYAATVQVVGPEGGVLTAGGHVLTIPAGALARPTVITMEAPSSLTARVRFSPHGLRFQVPPTLALSYARCAVPAGDRVGVAYVDGTDTVLEWPALRDTDAGVLAQIWHFSDYAASQRSTYAVSW